MLLLVSLFYSPFPNAFLPQKITRKFTFSIILFTLFSIRTLLRPGRTSPYSFLIQWCFPNAFDSRNATVVTVQCCHFLLTIQQQVLRFIYPTLSSHKMFYVRKPSENAGDSSAILSALSSMDIKAPSSEKESALKGNPLEITSPDGLCKLNLKETSEFVKAFPMTSAQRQRRSTEAPSTPGRPVFSFSAGNLSRKSIPSKWDDAEKWLISGSCHESPAHITKASDPSKITRDSGVLQQKHDAFGEKMRVARDKVSSFQGEITFSSEVVLQG